MTLPLEIYYMGIESESFVHPERIPNELFCPICTLVLENPVQTPTEHLFCEDELLEWLTRSGTILFYYSTYYVNHLNIFCIRNMSCN